MPVPVNPCKRYAASNIVRPRAVVHTVVALVKSFLQAGGLLAMTVAATGRWWNTIPSSGYENNGKWTWLVINRHGSRYKKKTFNNLFLMSGSEGCSGALSLPVCTQTHTYTPLICNNVASCTGTSKRGGAGVSGSTDVLSAQQKFWCEPHFEMKVNGRPHRKWWRR